MVFNFTFRFNGGLPNPFSSLVNDAPAQHALAESDSSVARGVRESDERSVRARIPKQHSQLHQRKQHELQQHQRRLPPPQPANSPSISRGSRKRAWEPTFAEPTSQPSSSSSTSSHGPSQSAIMSTNDSHDDHSTRGEDSRTELQPAPKRRRTLAGSILTTALSAALIGTAVGLTMYRLCVLWADRGHDHHERLLPPPPSYQEATANSNNHDNDSNHNKGPSTRPGTPIQSGKAQPSTPRHRKPRLRGNLARKNARVLRPIVHHSFHHHDRRTSVSSAGPATPTSTVQPEFDFSSMRIESSFNDDHEDERMEEDDDSEMSLIGDRIAALINEGKRALGREVVVSSERPEDEMDDGAGDWVEDDGSSPTVPHPFPLPARSAISRANSGNGGTKRRPSSLSATQAAGFSPVHRATLSTSSPRRSRVDSFGGGRRSLGGAFERNDSVDSVRSRREDEGEWESPELREFMRKARESRGLA